MKKLFFVLLALALPLTSHAYLTKSVTPNYPLAASSAMVTDANGEINASSTISATELGYLNGVSSNIQSQLTALNATALSGTFTRTCQIASASAATAVHCLTDADVGAGKTAYLTSFQAKVNGGTLWATTATCALQDTSAVAFVTWAVAGMGANALLFPGSANSTYADPYILGVGGTATKGIDLKCNANGTGSTFVVTITGVIK